jgi:hypothetical protein
MSTLRSVEKSEGGGQCWNGSNVPTPPSEGGWIHWSIGGLLHPDEPLAFASTIEAIEACGAVIASDGTVHGDAPAWVHTVTARWARFLRHAHQPSLDVWHVYACTECYLPELRRAAGRKRKCIGCGRGPMFELTIPWQTKPQRPRRRKT